MLHITTREARALALRRQGKTWSEVRATLGTSARDAKRYVRRALAKEAAQPKSA